MNNAKRGMDFDASQIESSSKRFMLFNSSPAGLTFLGSRTPYTLFKFLDVLQYPIPLTLQEAQTCVVGIDLAFLQCLLDVKKMKLISENTFHKFHNVVLVSITTASKRDVLTIENPSKERYIQNGKYFHAKDQEIHTENLTAIHKKVNEAIDEVLKVIFGAFKDQTDQVKFLCPSIQIPYLELDSKKLAWDEAIVEDNKDPKGGPDVQYFVLARLA